MPMKMHDALSLTAQDFLHLPGVRPGYRGPATRLSQNVVVVGGPQTPLAQLHQELGDA